MLSPPPSPPSLLSPPPSAPSSAGGAAAPSSAGGAAAPSSAGGAAAPSSAGGAANSSAGGAESSIRSELVVLEELHIDLLSGLSVTSGGLQPAGGAPTFRSY